MRGQAWRQARRVLEPGPLVDHIQQRLTVGKAMRIFKQDRPASVIEIRPMPCCMWCKEYVRRGPERMFGRQWLNFEDIESCPGDHPLPQRIKPRRVSPDTYLQ